MANKDKILAAVDRGNGVDQLRITLGEYKGRKQFNIRNWMKVDGEYIPTKRGICLHPPEDLEILLQAIHQAIEEMGGTTTAP